MSTVSKTNMDEIPDIIDEVVKAKAKVFAFSRYVPTGGEVDTKHDTGRIQKTSGSL